VLRALNQRWQLGLAAVLSVASLAACADQSGSSAGASDPSDSARIAASSSGSPILQLMQEAANTTAFRGVRRYRSRFGVESLEQVEDVGADGQGRLAFELVDVVSVPLSMDPFGYSIEAENAWRFQMTLRDPKIVSAFAAAQNYAISTLPETPMIAGIQCVRLRFERHGPLGDRPADYEVDVDRDTGFALAWREYDAAGLLMSSMVYESFEYDGDLSDMQLRSRTFNATPISLGQPFGPQVGFPVRMPQALPEGFEVVAAELMAVPPSLADPLLMGEVSYLLPGQWIRFLATDGVEIITFMHSAPDPSVSTVAGELNLAVEFDWKLAFGRAQGMNFICSARVSVEMLQQIIASVF
jgi:hypothetical protein